MNYRLIIFGSGGFGIPSFQSLVDDARFQVVAVVSQPPRPTGRRQAMTTTPVADWAKPRNLPVLTPETLRHNVAVADQLRAFQADAFVVADYGLIIPESILSIPHGRCLNIHASLLPHYRGASPITQAILHGDAETGVTFMRMDRGMDTGPILAQFPWPVRAESDTPQLTAELSLLAAENMLPVTISWLEGQLSEHPQPTSGISLAPKISVEDGRAEWSSALALARKVRAFQPWPSVWTTWGKYRIKFLSGQAETGQPEGPAGTIVADTVGWKIVCQDGWFRPHLIQFSGRKPQAASTVAGSYPAWIGSQLLG